jgi:hypothetical protein
MADLGVSNAAVACSTTAAFFYISMTPQPDGTMPPILVQDGTYQIWIIPPIGACDLSVELCSSPASA